MATDIRSVALHLDHSLAKIDRMLEARRADPEFTRLGLLLRAADRGNYFWWKKRNLDLVARCEFLNNRFMTEGY